MSSFNDAAFRSQALVQPMMMEAARRENEGILNIGNALVGASQQIRQAQVQNRELAIREAESAARLATFQQEQQLNEYKLRAMSMIDQAKMSRLQTRQAELAVEAAQAQIDERKSAMEENRADTRYREEAITGLRLSAMGKNPQERLQAGYIPDPNAPNGLGWRKADNPDELKEAQAQFADFERIVNMADPEEKESRLERISRMIQREHGVIGNLFFSPADKKAARERLKPLQAMYDKLTGKKDGPDDRDTTTGDSNQPKTRPTHAQSMAMMMPAHQTNQPLSQGPPQMTPGGFQSPWQEGTLQNTIATHPRWESADPFWGEIGKDHISRASLSQAMALYAPYLAEIKRVPLELMDSAIFQAVENEPQVMAYVLMASGGPGGADRSHADIKRILRRRFPNQADNLNEILRLAELAKADVMARYVKHVQGGNDQ